MQRKHQRNLHEVMNYSNMSVTISFSLYTLMETDELAGKLGGRGCCKASIFETPTAS